MENFPVDSPCVASRGSFIRQAVNVACLESLTKVRAVRSRQRPVRLIIAVFGGIVWHFSGMTPERMFHDLLGLGLNW
jgi:hypothetical protein